MTNKNQTEMTKAALALGVHRLSAFQHSALKLALWEHWKEATRRNDKKVLKTVNRWKVGKAFGFYATRRELWDGAA